MTAVHTNPHAGERPRLKQRYEAELRKRERITIRVFPRA